MKVCKFEKIKDEDDIKQVINCIRQEHPYVAVLPVLTQLQEWMQAISASWFHEEDEASHTTVNAIEEYCYSLTNHLITEPQLNQDMKIRIRECIKKIHALVEDKADLLIDKTIKAEIYGLSSDLFTYSLRQQGFHAQTLDPVNLCKSTWKENRISPISRKLSVNILTKTKISTFLSPRSLSVRMYMVK